MTIDCSKSLFIFKNSFIKSKEFNLSKLPVGSSAKIILGLLITARKVATRDLSPPDNWLGYIYFLLVNPTKSNKKSAYFIESLLEPIIKVGTKIFSKTVNSGIR